MGNLVCSDNAWWVSGVGSLEIFLMICHDLWLLCVRSVEVMSSSHFSFLCFAIMLSVYLPSLCFPRQTCYLSSASGMLRIYSETRYVVGSTSLGTCLLGDTCVKFYNK